jgi:glutamate mutase epsilon subunit
MQITPVSVEMVQAIAEMADVDFRTATRFLAGLPSRRRIARRLERAVAKIVKY